MLIIDPLVYIKLAPTNAMQPQDTYRLAYFRIVCTPLLARGVLIKNQYTPYRRVETKEGIKN